MSDLQAQFQKASDESTQLSKKPDNMTLLKMYALFKQGSKGDADGKRPGITNPVARAKWDAWNNLKGMTQEDAMQEYIDTVEDLKAADA